MTKVIGLLKCRCLLRDTEVDLNLKGFDGTVYPRECPAPHEMEVDIPIMSVEELRSFQGEDFNEAMGNIQKRVEKMYEGLPVMVTGVQLEEFNAKAVG